MACRFDLVDYGKKRLIHPTFGQDTIDLIDDTP